jgi:hypothetical protein
MGDLEIVTTADRRDLDEQARDAFRAVWPEFMFHDPISSEYIGRVETYFPQYDVLLLDDGQVVAGGWGVPIRWDGTISTLPDGYDGALASAVTGQESSVPADTLCIMAAAVKADRQGSGLAGKTLTALRDRAVAAGLERVIAPVRPALKSRYPLTPMETSRAGPGATASTPTRGSARTSGLEPASSRRPRLYDHHWHRARMGTLGSHGIPRIRPICRAGCAGPGRHRPRARSRDIRRNEPVDAPCVAWPCQMRARTDG